MMGKPPALLLAAALLGAAPVTVAWPAVAQSPATVADSLTTAGVDRASALINAVFVDRTETEAVISGGDMGSYIMARLGVYPIPVDLKFRVTVDTQMVVLFGTIADLPLVARAALSPLLGMFPVSTRVDGEIVLRRAGPEVWQFHLATVRVNGVPLPEGLVARVMTQLGATYPALSRTGRDLYLRVPPDGELTLMMNAVRAWRVPPP
jgi:hypothetical protein